MSPAIATVNNADALAVHLAAAGATDIAAVLRDVQAGRLIIRDADAIAATSLKDAIAEVLPDSLSRDAIAASVAYAVIRFYRTPRGAVPPRAPKGGAA